MKIKLLVVLLFFSCSLYTADSKPDAQGELIQPRSSELERYQLNELPDDFSGSDIEFYTQDTEPYNSDDGDSYPDFDSYLAS